MIFSLYVCQSYKTNFCINSLFSYNIYCMGRKAARGKLTINNIGVKSIKSADLNMNSLLLSYFLPCIELFKKDPIFIFGWFVVLIILIVINRGTYFYNPIIKLFGYRYYEVTTNSGVVYTMISKKKLVNTNEVKRYSQLTDYVILNQL